MNSGQRDELECLQCVLDPGEVEVMGEVTEENDTGNPHKWFHLVFRITDPETTFESHDGGAVSQIHSNDITKTKSLYLNARWPVEYLSDPPKDPAATPKITLDDDSRNSQLSVGIREKIETFIEEKVNDLRGEQMTLAIVEALKSEAFTRFGLNELIQQLTESPEGEGGDCSAASTELTDKAQDAQCRGSTMTSVDDLRGLTKAQKRRYHDRVRAADGSRPRGWNWVDIISHLSKVPLSTDDSK